jgi:hypothetical protein
MTPQSRWNAAASSAPRLRRPLKQSPSWARCRVPTDPPREIGAWQRRPVPGPRGAPTLPQSRSDAQQPNLLVEARPRVSERQGERAR